MVGIAAGDHKPSSAFKLDIFPVFLYQYQLIIIFFMSANLQSPHFAVSVLVCPSSSVSQVV